MQRRSLFTAALLAGSLALFGCQEPQDSAAAQASPAPATQTWKMVTAWPKNYPGLGTAAERFAQRVEAMSGGRLKIKVYAAGELVPALEVFDAVSRGTAELGHGAAYYWKGKVPAAQFFTAVPFGLSTLEMNAWVTHGGGLALWQEAYAPYGVRPLLVGNSTMQMGGWFNKEINSLDDIKGLKIRMPGLGGEVWSRLGAITVNLPGGEIFTSLQTGAIDATDWVGPYNDLAFGLHKAAKYNYFPGWQEPQAVVEAMVNQKAFDALPTDLQAIVVEAARAATLDMMDDYVFNNAKALQSLKSEGVQFKRLPDEVLQAMREQSNLVLEALAAENDLNGRIWASQKAFLEEASAMQALTEKELYNWR